MVINYGKVRPVYELGEVREYSKFPLQILNMRNMRFFRKKREKNKTFDATILGGSIMDGYHTYH